MPKFNIYKINKEEQFSLERKFSQAGLEKINTRRISNHIFDFYLSTEPDRIDIWWTDFYRDFLENINEPKNNVYFGALIIYNQEYCYVISLGKTHFYLKPFCDLEFGINLAERIIDVNNLKIKSSRFYKSKRNKSITTFSNDTSLDYDSGESLHYIKANTINENEWGKVASFGHSVQLKLDIGINELPNLITRIENKLEEEPIHNFPKAEIIKNDEEIERLDAELSVAIMSEESNVNNEEFDLSGVDFIFSDNYSFIFKIWDQGLRIESEVYDDLNIENLRSFVNSNGIDLKHFINNIKIFVLREEGRGFSKPIKYAIHYVTESREALIDGKWYSFNQSYIDLITAKVGKIRLNHLNEFDYSQSIIEEVFIEDRKNNNGYLKLHTNFTNLNGRFRVEQADMYKDEVLYFVKKGTPQKLNYVIDQASNTLKLLKSNAFAIENEGENLIVSTVNLWILVSRATLVNSLSDFNSLIFIMKLNELYKDVLDSGLQMEVNINYLPG